MIKFGDIAYFVLLDLQSKLKFRDYSKLGLDNLDVLRKEIDDKVEQIHLEHKKSKGEIYE